MLPRPRSDLKPNTADFERFPLVETPKDGKTILIEGWMPGNPSKDIHRLGPRVAACLKQDGYHIIAFSAQPNVGIYSNVPHEFYHAPSDAKLNELYARATLLIKASLYDARAGGPMEAMTKGTVTARALIKGDDDLVDHDNSLRCDYNESDLYFISKCLLEERELREKLVKNCYDYVATQTWDHWMPKIKEVIWQSLLS